MKSEQGGRNEVQLLPQLRNTQTILLYDLSEVWGDAMTSQLDSTGTAAVDHNYFWQPIETCPRGAKVQLLGKGGVAMYGSYNGKDDFYTHWCPLPKLKKS